MQRFHLPDMSCGHCVAAISEALKAADPAARIDVDRDAKIASVDSTLPRERLAAALTEAGYPPAPADTPA
jgi:copper chaperone